MNMSNVDIIGSVIGVLVLLFVCYHLFFGREIEKEPSEFSMESAAHFTVDAARLSAYFKHELKWEEERYPQAGIEQVDYVYPGWNSTGKEHRVKLGHFWPKDPVHFIYLVEIIMTVSEAEGKLPFQVAVEIAELYKPNQTPEKFLAEEISCPIKKENRFPIRLTP